VIAVTAVATLATSILGAASAALATVSAGPPQVQAVVPGAIAWDACECGQLSVSWQRIYLSDAFPTDAAGSAILHQSSCQATLLVAEFLIQVIRCAPVPQGVDQTVPTSELEAAAFIVAEDGLALITNVACSLQEMMDRDEIDNYEVRSQTAVGPQGACVGSELALAVSLRR
jgi:hypothetical protein